MLYQNFPNPVTERTRIDFELVQDAVIQIRLYGPNGFNMEMLKRQEMPRGYHTLRFRRGALPAGVYCYSLTAGNEIRTRRMIIL